MTGGETYGGQVWGYDEIDTNKLSNHHHSGPKLPSVSPTIVTNLALLDYFLILVPIKYVKGTMLLRNEPAPT